jgi:hypothetical protein
MRKNNNKGNVRTITTGHIEGDMLGQVFLWLSERQNSRYAQRPHRTYKRRPSPESKVRVFFRAAIEWSQTAPTACLRSIRDRISKMRKQKRNGN